MASNKDCPRCKTCVHYVKSKNWEGVKCANEQIGEDYGADRSKPWFLYPYTEGGEMSPSPDFGCVLHKSVKSDE